MADFEKIAGRITLLVPLAHVVTCGLYMAGYSLGFGGNIGGMFAASDFFTITIQKLIATYLLSLAFPVMFILCRHRSGYTYATDAIEAESDPARKVAIINSQNLIVFVASRILPIFVLLFILINLAALYVGRMISYYLLFNMIILGLVSTWWWAMRRLNIYGLQAEIGWCVLAFSVGVVGLGLDTGQRDRRLPYAAFAKTHMSCSTHAVLSPIGGRFLSVTPDNRRHLIDAECKSRFQFPQALPFAHGTLPELVRRQWRS